jgi:acyl-CoA thioester hydrolase
MTRPDPQPAAEGDEPVSTPHAAPARAQFEFWWPQTVRWGDMDAMGHVNNALYFQYMESARVGFFERLGWRSREMGAGRGGPVVVSQTFNYRRQLHYPAEIEVGIACSELRRRSFVLAYGIFRQGNEELIGDGSTVLVWMDYALGRAVELPADIRQLFPAAQAKGAG